MVEWGCGLVHVCMCFGFGMSHGQDPSMTTRIQVCGGVGVGVWGCVSVCAYMYVLWYGYESRLRSIYDNFGAGTWVCGGMGVCVCLCVRIHVCASVWV